jgi:hypothetical protein
MHYRYIGFVQIQKLQYLLHNIQSLHQHGSMVICDGVLRHPAVKQRGIVRMLRQIPHPPLGLVMVGQKVANHFDVVSPHGIDSLLRAPVKKKEQKKKKEKRRKLAPTIHFSGDRSALLAPYLTRKRHANEPRGNIANVQDDSFESVGNSAVGHSFSNEVGDANHPECWLPLPSQTTPTFKKQCFTAPALFQSHRAFPTGLVAGQKVLQPLLQPSRPP